MAKAINLKDSKSKTKKSRIDLVKENREKKKKSSKIKSTKKFKKKAFKVLLILAGIFFFALLMGSVAAISYVQSLNDELPSTDSPFGPTPIATEIYDRKALEEDSKGTTLYKVFDEFNAEPVDINEIPEHVKWAFLAAEDRDFYTHGGFDITGIASCALKNIKDRSSVCGGSTVTQQLLKLRLFKQESPVKRKIKEILMSTKIEQTYEKDEILQMYLTVTPYGSSIVGITSAADFYFGKEPKDLTLAEASILAAIVNFPASLSPTVPLDGDKERAQADVKIRQEYILKELEKHKDSINNQIRKNKDDKNYKDVFTDEIISQARKEELNYRAPIATDKKAGHFVDYVLEKLQTGNYKNGEEPFTLEELQQGGLRIVTTLDYEQQQAAEEMASKGGSSYDYWNVNNAAILTIDPSSGQILAMAGSKDYYAEESIGCNEEGTQCKFDPQVNVLTSLNEPGSTNKPLAYALAFEEGKLAPGSNLPDIPIDYPELGYSPKNWDGRNLGADLTARAALVQSRNIPALQVIEMITIDKYLDAAQNLGITTYDRSAVGPSLVLGGASVRYTEQVGAFASFANEGNYIPLDPILKITDSKGKVLYEAKPEKKQVLSSQSVFLLNEVLHDLQQVTSHTGIPLSCKTGTTENNIEALQICWNSNQLTLAWAGNNNNDPLDPANGYPILVVQPWLEEYLSKISSMSFYEGKDPALKRPGYVYIGSGCKENTNCTSPASDWLIQDKVAPTYMEKKKFTVCTDQPDRLARDIDKALGKSQEIEITRYIMPASRWQNNLDEYIKNNKGHSNTFPSEECNIDRTNGSNGPVVLAISNPVSGTKIQNNSVNVKGSVASTSGNIKSLTFQLNNQNIGSTKTYQNFNLNLDISSLNLVAGTYEFKAIATDSSGNTGTYSVNVSIPASDSLSFTDMPPANLKYLTQVGPGKTHTIEVKYSGSGSATNVRLYQIKTVNGSSSAPEDLGNMNNTSGSKFKFNWGDNIQNEDAEYTFYAIATTSGGSTIQSGYSSTVTVESSP